MNRFFSHSALSLFASSVFAVSMHCVPGYAQTGPVAGDLQASNSPIVNPSQNAKMTADRLGEHLRSKGAAVNVQRLPKGDIVNATIVHQGWRTILKFSFTGASNIDVVCPLDKADHLTADRLMRLLKKGHDLSPMHFTIRPSDGRLLLEDPFYNPTGMTTKDVDNVVERITKVVRETHSVWGGGQPTANPAPPVCPADAPCDKKKVFQDQLTANDQTEPIAGTFQRSYAIALKGGVEYVIDMTSTQFDTYLILKTCGGHIVAQDDDSGGNRDARIRYTPPTDGKFLIVATSFRKGATGNFTVTVTEGSRTGTVSASSPDAAVVPPVVPPSDGPVRFRDE